MGFLHGIHQHRKIIFKETVYFDFRMADLKGVFDFALEKAFGNQIQRNNDFMKIRLIIVLA
jgi:hypothetical protein